MSTHLHFYLHLSSVSVPPLPLLGVCLCLASASAQPLLGLSSTSAFTPLHSASASAPPLPQLCPYSTCTFALSLLLSPLRLHSALPPPPLCLSLYLHRVSFISYLETLGLVGQDGETILEEQREEQRRSKLVLEDLM